MPSKRATSKKKKGDKGDKGDEGALLAEMLKEAFANAASTSLPATKGQPVLPLGEKPELSIREASALTGYTSQLIVEAIHDGSLEASKRSGRWTLKREDIDNWLKRL